MRASSLCFVLSAGGGLSQEYRAGGRQVTADVHAAWPGEGTASMTHTGFPGCTRSCSTTARPAAHHGGGHLPEVAADAATAIEHQPGGLAARVHLGEGVQDGGVPIPNDLQLWGLQEWREVEPGAPEEGLEQAGPVLHPAQPGLNQRGELADGVLDQLGQGPFQQRPGRLSRLAIVHGSLARRAWARRLSAGRAWSGWWSGLGG